MTADGRWLLAGRALRSLGYGLFSVILGLHLDAAGYAPAAVGLVITLSLAGSAGLTALLASSADRFGRKRALLWSGALMVIGGVVFILTDHVVALAAAALTGTINPSAPETGPFETVESAILPQAVTGAARNRAFGWYHAVGAVALALGSLAAGALDPIAAALGLDELGAYHLGYVLYTGAALLCLLVLARLSPAVEPPGPPKRNGLALQRSRKTVFRLAALFSLDAFAGGFVVQSIVVYWFSLRFGVGLAVLGPVFGAVSLLKALSYVVAVRLADRFGLVRTMVFTHLPSNVLLLLLPAMPSLPLAIGILLIRHMLAQMDVPARTSYVVAIVDPEERTAASGVTMLVRPAAQAASPVLAGLAIQLASSGAPFLIAGSLKIVYDLLLYAGFRRLAPEEERAR
ncbi:MAG TPA: MFS transporter [Anaerolineales bacterium]